MGVIRPSAIGAALLLLVRISAAQSQVEAGSVFPRADEPLRTGYAILTPETGSSGNILAFETFGLRKGNEILHAGILPVSPTTTATLFVSTSLRLSRNLGIAVANPGAKEARLTFTIRRDDGILLGSNTIFLPPRWQTSQLITQIFAGRPDIPVELVGTLDMVSTVPVSVVGLRFRGESFSTEPLTGLSTGGTVPERFPGVGGGSAVMLPQVAAGAGWATEIVIMNPGSEVLFVRVDLFSTDGGPLELTLNGETRSTFRNLRIRPGGVITLSSLDSKGDSPF